MRKLEAASRQVDRLGRLVSELMDVSRLSAGRLHLDLDRVELAAIVRDAITRHKEDAARAGSEIRLIADAPVVGTWDRMRLEQVITNLLVNAFKFGAGKPVELAVERHDGAAVLVVRDQGIGIGQEDIDRIFQRFERAASARTYAGMGLGLYITRQIVEAHGGTIRVESRPGTGSTFTVELPCEPPERKPDDRAGNGSTPGRSRAVDA
jgi:signal transduction histidine kinase